MAHRRKVIRDAARTALLSRTVAGTKVETTRRLPYRTPELPCLAIYSLVEPVDPASRMTAPRELKRHLQLAVVGTLRTTPDTVDDDLDAFALEIEKAIAADDTLGGACADAVLASTEFDYDETADREIAAVRLTFDVTYYTGAPEAEDVTLEDLKTVDTRFTNLDGDGTDIEDDDQAEDLLEDLDA